MSRIYSMTGYARGEGDLMGCELQVEAKSVNHRYLDVKIRLPRGLLGLEQEIMKLIRATFSRGHIEVWADFKPGEVHAEVAWNRALAEGMLRAMAEMKKELGLAGEPDLSLLASQKDVILIAESHQWGEDVWPALREVFGRVFEGLLEMRAVEGEALAEDILVRLGGIEDKIEAVSGKAGSIVEVCRDRLVKRIADLMPTSIGVDMDRVLQESAIIADRADVSEELTRAKSHLAQFRAAFSESGPIGRKLDFLLQELFREINTLANKAQDSEVSTLAVEMKAELEKIREQVQNLE